MQIRMLEDRQVAPDGIHVKWFRLGGVHNLPDVLAESMIMAGQAAAVDVEAQPKAEISHQPKQESHSEPRTHPTRRKSKLNPPLNTTNAALSTTEPASLETIPD